MDPNRIASRIKIRKTVIPAVNDDEWIKANFKTLIHKFPGQYVIVCGGESFVGKDAGKLERQARKAHPEAKITTGMPIPRKEDLLPIITGRL